MAQGDSLANFGAVHAVMPSSGGAVWDVRNNRRVIRFSDASDLAAIFEGVLPANYAGNGLTVRLTWRPVSATTGNVRWSAAIERVQAAVTNIDSDAFAAAQAATGAAPASLGPVVTTDIVMTNGSQMGNLQAKEVFRLRVTRVGADAADTMVGDAELISVQLLEGTTGV